MKYIPILLTLLIGSANFLSADQPLQNQKLNVNLEEGVVSLAVNIPELAKAEKYFVAEVTDQKVILIYKVVGLKVENVTDSIIQRINDFPRNGRCFVVHSEKATKEKTVFFHVKNNVVRMKFLLGGGTTVVLELPEEDFRKHFGIEGALEPRANQ